jgi:hypothetical protein
MNTTNLYVELIVVGMGFLINLSLCFFAVFDPQLLVAAANIAILLVVPLLSLTYVLGIIMDRVADWLFEKPLERMVKRWQVFASDDDYIKARNQVTYHGGHASTFLEYSRSRMRICRGWFVNFLLLHATLTLFVFFRVHDPGYRLEILLITLPLLAVLAGSCVFAWRRLYRNEITRIKNQNEFLSTMNHQKQEAKQR